MGNEVWNPKVEDLEEAHAHLSGASENLRSVVFSLASELVGGCKYLAHLVFCHAKFAIGRRLGIEEPQLMKIISATLYTHSEWFKLQMCKDRFEGLLKIDTLKDASGYLMIDAASRLDVDMCSDRSSQVTASSNNKKQEDGSPTQSSAGDIGCDEAAILKVMIKSLASHGEVGYAWNDLDVWQAIL